MKAWSKFSFVRRNGTATFQQLNVNVPDLEMMLVRPFVNVSLISSAVRMDDQAGALTDVLQALNRANVNVEYVYAFTGSAALSAYVVFRVDDVPHAETVLREAGIPTLDDETILKLL